MSQEISNQWVETGTIDQNVNSADQVVADAAEQNNASDVKKSMQYVPLPETHPDFQIQQNLMKIRHWLEIFLTLTLAVRLICLFCFAFGCNNKRTSRLAGCCEKTVYNLRRKQNQEGQTVDQIMTIQPGSGRKSKVKRGFLEQIAYEVRNARFPSLLDIVEHIDICFGIRLSIATVWRIMKKLKFKKRKVGSLPAKADLKEQRTFYENILLPAMEMAKKGIISLFFVDASHFVMGNDFLGSYWGDERKYERTLSGRYRWNVLAAMDFIAKKMITVTNDTYITATQVVELLHQVRASCDGVVYFILDNARYQKCKLVMQTAEELGIVLFFLPTYSPNLNLIERSWKFVKKILRKSTWDNTALFSACINEIIAEFPGKYKAQADSLIGEKVQLFDSLVQKTAKGKKKVSSAA